jgi:hypothetical protein
MDEQGEQQIPFGDDNQRGKGNGKSNSGNEGGSKRKAVSSES